MTLTEHLEKPSAAWTFVLGTAPLALLAVLFGTLALLNQAAPEAMQPVWNGARAASYLVGIAAAFGVTYRLVMMAGDAARWHDPRAVHLMLWFGWIVGISFLASLGARYYDQLQVDATWISGARLVFHLLAIWLCWWWPHPAKFVPVEQRPATP